MDQHMKYCQGCKFARYCNEKCQKTHWKHGHKCACADIKNEFHYIELRHYGLISQVTFATWLELIADMDESLPDPSNVSVLDCLREGVDDPWTFMLSQIAAGNPATKEEMEQTVRDHLEFRELWTDEKIKLLMKRMNK